MNAALHFLAPSPWAWALLAVPALALAFWAYYGLLAPLSRPARWVLWCLRGAALLLVVFALLQPVLTLVLPDSGHPDLALLVDMSASMGLPDGSGAETRAAAALRSIDALERGLGDRFRIRRYTFTDAPSSWQEGPVPVPAGNTGIGTALEELRGKAGSRPTNGVILLSDGVNTVGRDPVRLAAASTFPVFTVSFGPESPPQDLEIRIVRANPTAFAGEPMPIRAVLSSSGLAGRSVRIVVEQAGSVLDAKDVVLHGDGMEQEVAFDVTPVTPGLNLYQVAVEDPVDSIPENDLRQVAVDVLDRRTQILIMSNRLDWDLAFLRRTVEADTTLRYSYLVRTADDRLDSFGSLNRDTWPVSIADLRDYAAVMLTGFDETGPPAATRNALAEFVRQGGGLFLLGGPGRPGGWTESGELGRALPGRVSSAGAEPPSRLAPASVTLDGQRHSATAVHPNPAETASLWAALPPIWQMSGVFEAGPQARVLLEYNHPRGQRRPMLAVSFHEKGKTAWLHGQGIWRWGFASAGVTGAADVYRPFLLGLVRWLAEPAVRERFQAAPSKRVYQNGEPVAFLAGLWDEAFRPVSGARVRVAVASSADSASVLRLELRSGAESGAYDGEGPALPPGAYSYEAEVLDGNGVQLPARTSGRFWVETMGPEFSRTWADRQTLARIAEESGGTTVEASALESLFDLIPDRVRRTGRVSEREIWNDWILFCAFILVLSVEWFLRRRRGLA